MLTLTYTPNGIRKAENLLPVGENEMAVRPGAQQIIDGNVNSALGWDNAVIFERYGYLMIWHVVENVLSKHTAGTRLNGCTFQALTGYGDRQKRFYISNGETIFYVYRRPNDVGDMQLYDTIEFENECLDENNQPYPIPKAQALATWRNRLWALDGTHILYHTEHDKPHYWDPINSISIQSGQQSDVAALIGFGNRLIVATPDSVWQVTGDSKYNFELTKIVADRGAVGDKAIATDGNRLFYIDRRGVFELGQDEPISDDIGDIFYKPDSSAQLLIDAKMQILFLSYNRRIFAWHMRYRNWGEVIMKGKGLFRMSDRVGSFGVGGLWLLNNHFSPDIALNGVKEPVKSVMRTWQAQPNPTGMTDLLRVYIGAEGSYQTEATYKLFTDVDGDPILSSSFPFWRTIPNSITVGDTAIFNEKPQFTTLDVAIQVCDYQFEHEITAQGYWRLRRFEPVYRMPNKGE